MGEACERGCEGRCQHLRLQSVIDHLSVEVAKEANIPVFTRVEPYTVTEQIFNGRPSRTWELNPIIYRNRDRGCNRCALPACLCLICGQCGTAFTRNSDRLAWDGSLCSNYYNENFNKFLEAACIVYNFPLSQLKPSTFGDVHTHDLIKQVWALKRAIQPIQSAQKT